MAVHVPCFQAKMSTEPVNVNEFQELAKKVLPKMHYDFISGGSEDQNTLKQNVEAFKRIRQVFFGQLRK